MCATGPCPCLSSREDPAYPSSEGWETDTQLAERARLDAEHRWADIQRSRGMTAPAETASAAEAAPAPERPRRRLVVVDTETTGLTEKDIIVEVAWWDLGTDERGRFIPRHDVAWVLSNAHPDALAINGYEARLANAPQDDGTELVRLHHALRGQCLGGSNVRYDAAKLARLFAVNRLHPEPWFYHLSELSPFACGVLGLPLTDPPGLSACCDLLGVTRGDHTAEADVTATGECFRALMAKAGVA